MTIDFQSLSTLESTLAVLATAIPPVITTDARMYPFVGEKAVRARLEADDDLRVVNAVLMYHLQEAFEQSSKETKDKNRRGYMSSHARTATTIVQSLLLGVEPADGTFSADGSKFEGWQSYLTHIGGRYAKQLAVSLRTHAIIQDPALGITAAMFSVK